MATHQKGHKPKQQKADQNGHNVSKHTNNVIEQLQARNYNISAVVACHSGSLPLW